MKEEYWIGSNGESIAVSKMTEEHMRNALRKLIREGRIISILDPAPLYWQHKPKPPQL